MPTSVYIHIPFCRHRCAYCDFNTYDDQEPLVEPYMAALNREIRTFKGRMSDSVGSVFFGGGTPSLVPLETLAGAMAAVRDSFNLERGAEITLEANPGTVSLEYLTGLRELGVNRLSMGMQSASPEDLRILEREHDVFDVIDAVAWARRAGFENLNLDLIFGLPYQSFESWARTLDTAVGLNPDHLSVYNLILERGTPMNAWVGRGLMPAPDDDLAADMYDHARSMLPGHGFEQYEISNWARRNGDGGLMVCRHNLQYWRGLPYLGLGAGAHGYAAGVRTINARTPGAYIERMTRQAHRSHPFKVDARPEQPAHGSSPEEPLPGTLVDHGTPKTRTVRSAPEPRADRRAPEPRPVPPAPETSAGQGTLKSHPERPAPEPRDDRGISGTRRVKKETAGGRAESSRGRPYPRTPATARASMVSREDAMGETMMMGLRLTREGVADREFRGRFGIGIAQAFPEQVEDLESQGLIEWADGVLRLTERGVLLGNRVFAAFIG